MLTRRATIVALGAASVGTVLGVRPGRTQTFPNRPVTIVVPYPPGGSVDVMVRILAAAMGPDLGTTFVIENKGGGAGAIGTVLSGLAPRSLADEGSVGYRARLSQRGGRRCGA
jgi:tripartite-type tricarboxylate transporter receptor subunit TctC